MNPANPLNEAFRACEGRDSHIWGREALLDQLMGCWSTVSRGRPLVVRLLGDPGIGKTALIRALTKRLGSEAQVVMVGAAPDLAHASYRFLDALVTAWRGAEEDFGPDAAAVWHLLGRSSMKAAAAPSPKATWFIAFRALARWLTRRIDQKPCLLVLEDLHWIDQGSLEFLEYWLNDMDSAVNRALMLMVSERSGGGYHFRTNGLGSVILTVPPLDDEDAFCLAAHRLGFDAQTLPESLQAEARAILKRAQGNPFLLTELINSWAVSGAIPPTIRAAAQARFKELNPSAQSLLALAAVAGYRLDLCLLNALLPANSRPLLELLNAGFLQADGHAYRFCHELMQQALYEALDADGRREWHARIAAFMLKESAALPAFGGAEAARHLLGAGRPREAREMLQQAADYALQRHDLREGRDLLARALELFDSAEAEFGALSVRLAEVELARAEGPEARRRLEALDGAKTPGWTLAMTRVHERLGEYELARKILREALAGEPPAHERAALELTLAQLDLRQGDTLACEQRASCQLERDLTRAERGLAFSLMGVACYRMGRFEEAFDHHHRALGEREACQDLVGLASTYNNLGSLYYDQGRWNEAFQAYHQGKNLSERIGEAWLSSSFDNNLGNIALNQGDWEGAERHYRASLAIKERLAERAGIAIARCNLGNALGRMGRLDEAREMLRGAIALMEQIGDREVLADLYAHLGMIEVEACADDLAWASLQHAIDFGSQRERTVPVGIALRGQSILLLRREDPARALELIQSSLALLEGAFTSLEHARSLAQAAKIVERLGEAARASAYRICAGDVFEKLGAKIDLARLKEYA